MNFDSVLFVASRNRAEDPAAPSVSDLLDGWGQVPSDPLLSEHTRARLQAGRGWLWTDDHSEALVTLVPGTGASGLVEMAGSQRGRIADLWESSEADVISVARGAGFPTLHLLDRRDLVTGHDLIGGTLRMVLASSASTGSIADADTSPSFQPGDEPGVLDVINTSLAGHPESGDWTREDLEYRLKSDWFDPAGLLLERDDGRVMAVCWTKVHPDGVGEIYLLAVLPRRSRRGLGRRMLQRGLDRLAHSAWSGEVIVYTEEGNEVARKLYSDAGFVADRVERRFVIDLS